jgi:hypothetical protein
MKKSMLFIIYIFVVFVCSHPCLAYPQTLIGKEQIEDAFLLKSGGMLYGDVSAATSAIEAATFDLNHDVGLFHIFCDGSKFVIQSNLDIKLDPTNEGLAHGKIIPATMIEFVDFLGDKIRFYSHSYSIGVSPYDLDITSDQNIKFHSDTVPDLMVIQGDEGDVQVKRDVISGGVFKFSQDSAGDKLRLFGTLYRLAISSSTMDFYSDQNFAWHSDTQEDAMLLNGDTGRLTLSGPLKLPVYDALPSGEVGDLIYFDHASDNNQDGAYIRCATDWRKCN